MTPSEALGALWSVTAHGHDHLFQIDFRDGSRRETAWIPVGEPDRFVRLLATADDPKVGLVPRRDRHPDGLAESHCFWASIENPVSVRGLAAFRPLPTLLFRKGAKRVAVWWLTGPLPMTTDPLTDWVTRGNKRLAFALKANSRHADPEWLMPVLDLEDACPDRMYAPREVVGKLRDAPLRSGPHRKLSAV